MASVSRMSTQGTRIAVFVKKLFMMMEIAIAIYEYPMNSVVYAKLN